VACCADKGQWYFYLMEDFCKITVGALIYIRTSAIAVRDSRKYITLTCCNRMFTLQKYVGRHTEVKEKKREVM
jgi:hypothetical protein